eukprot:s1008_g3.t1
MGILVHLRPIVPQGPVLLQLATTLLTGHGRQTRGPVAHTHGPCTPCEESIPAAVQQVKASFATALIGDPTLHLPEFIELQAPPSAQLVQEELRSWGHQVLALDCHPHNKFFCVADSDADHWDCKHYLFCHQDLADDQGCFAHSVHDWLTENQLMTFLCSLGYARAVILQDEVISDTWHRVLFHHQEPQQEERPTNHRQRSPWPPSSLTPCRAAELMIDLASVESFASDCILRTDFDRDDLAHFFASADDVLCRDFNIDGLPEHVKEALAHPLVGDIDWSVYDRLLIFTDGSSKPAARRLPPLRADDMGLNDTWAFLVVGERFASERQAALIQPIGWMAHPILYNSEAPSFTGTQRLGSDQAERAAMTFAGLWRLAQNTTVPTVLCTDSVTTGGQAFGELGAAEVCASFRLLRGIYQSLHFALAPAGLQLYPVRAHAGDPYNDFVDFVAKAEAAKSFHHLRQRLDLQLWRPRIDHFWMIFAKNMGLPAWRNGGFEVPAPSLPSLEVSVASSADHQRIPQPEAIECAISLATANVQSLSKGPQGYGGKLHYLQAQMKQFGISCLGVQEARTASGFRVAHDVLCFATGAGDGGYGVELWINLTQPIGWQAHQQRSQHKCKSYFFQRNDFVVVYGDERRLLVRCTNSIFNSWLFVSHAPHSGRAAAERQQWWHFTQNLLHEHCDSAPLFWMMDANAAPGAMDGVTVHRPGFAHSLNTPFLKEALHQFGLCLPATSDCHRGDNHTWTAVDGVTGHCIDHLAVPQSWLPHCVHSEVLVDFDLAQMHDDHKAVALQIQWQTYIHPKSNPKATHFNPQSFTSVDFKKALNLFQPAAWTVDAEEHEAKFESYLHQTMRHHLPAARTAAKKLYVTDEIWALRNQKLVLRKTCQNLRKKLALESLRTCFLAWTSPDPLQSTAEIFNYGTTLRCYQLKYFSGFCSLKKRMRQLLQKSKSQFLAEALAPVADRAPASELLRVMKPFIGPTNPKKQKRKTLPLIYNQDQQPCATPEDALNTWVTFFQQMEGGIRIEPAELRRMWIHDLAKFSQTSFDIDMQELPSLTDVEVAFRRVPAGRARGPDHIPGEVCHLHAPIMAAQIFSQLMKIVIHGQEPMRFKGGCLTPAWKGKGDTHLVSSYRSLLVSSNIGKIIHRSIRQLHASTYEHWLQSQQIGGRRHVPVQLALHQARSFLRRVRRQHACAGLLFLDLTEAFYRVLREFTLGGYPTDELLAFVLKRLNLPEDSLHMIHDMLDNQTILQRAGMSRAAMNCIRAIHANTHFWLAGQSDIVATYIGTRPGDCFADTIFGFTWSLVLKKLEGYMEENGTIAQLPVPQQPPFFATQQDPLESPEYKSYLGPTWMDDLCLCMYGGSPADLEQKLGANIGYLLDLCEAHLMSANLSKGKTELLLSFGGTGSRAMTTKYYGPQSSGYFQVLCEHQMKQVAIVKSYRHLGGQLHHTSDQCSEIRIKTAVAHTAFNQHRRLMYNNEKIPLAKRSEFFNTLVLTKMLYGADSWVAGDVRTMKKFSAAVLRLYQRLLRWKPTEHVSAADVLVASSLPDPAILLRRTRLRYLVVLFQCGLSNVWHVLSEDQQWIQLVEDDLVWMWMQLSASSSLPDPRVCIASWYELLQYHPRYWKRLVRRACHHAHLQLCKDHGVASFHARVFQRLNFEFDKPLNSQPDHFPSDSTVCFGCMGCGIKCRNRAGEAAHMFKKHGQLSILRHFIDQTQCSVCLKEFHTFGKLKAHLYYSATCRAAVLGGPFCPFPAPGKGSEADRHLEDQHDRCLPPLQAAGPLPLQPRPRGWHDMDDELRIFMVDFVATERSDLMDIDEFESEVSAWILGHAISWTRTRNTLQFFLDSLTPDDADALKFDFGVLQGCLHKLMDSQHWSFLASPACVSLTLRTIAESHQECGAWSDFLQQQALLPVPRVLGRHRIILHAFAGRRRLGDLQYFLERALDDQTPYLLTVVSLDIVINATWGDASRAQTRQLWLTAIRDKHVVGFVAGPPCETWSRVRGVRSEEAPEVCHQVADAAGFACAHTARLPRILRDLHDLWGFPALAIRELEQILVGNTLLCFAFEAIVEAALAGTIGLLEHPAEPHDLADAASIWRLPMLRLIELLPGVERVTFAQGLMGAKTAKPTELLCVNLPHIMRFLHANRVRTEIPYGQSVGKNSDGKWHTAALKEYSPALCKAMADAIRAVFDSCEVTAESGDIPTAFIDLCLSMQAEQMAKLTVTLETEPGLTMSEYWSPLQVRQYSPRSVRLVFFTQYWLLNRRSDCRVCLPHPEIATARGAGMAKFWTKRPNGGARLSLMQFDCNTLRMVSENLVRRGKIQVGLCDQRYNANGESLVPVTQSIRINQPTVGSATAPRTPFNPVQRCFGYTVRPAPLPFYRTLLVEVVRRYTLLNHKEHVLFCLEKDACLAPLELLAGAWASFDPQGANLQIAITGIANNGMAPGSSISETSRRNQRASTVPQGRQSPLSPKRRAVTWADAGEELDLEAGELTEQQEFFSAPFVLAESSRRSFQLMHLCDLSHWDAAALERGALLARPEPLLGPPQPATGIGRAWCLTAVDTLVEQSSVVVRFSEPLRPQFRILNRTGHSLGLRQDCDKAPAFELAPEQRMSFCWFQPEGPLRLCLRLGSQEISYEVGTVEEHSPPLRVEKTPPAGGAFAGVVREEFLVQTKVSRGSREVHIHPHCLLKNSKGHALLVRSGIKGSGTAMVVPHEGSVCLQRESKVSEQVALEIASFIPGSSVAHWSAPIMLTKNLAGHRGFLRHMKSGGSGMTSVFEITMVDVKKDPISDFLLVELRPYVKANCPYFFENDSRQVCSVSQLDGPEAGAPLDLFPGESAPFVPVGAVICGQGTFHVRLAVLGSKDEIQYSTVMDIELPQEAVFGSMHVKVLKERPRHIILRDVNDVKEKVCRKGLKQSLPPFLFLQRLLGGTKPQRKISLSPRRRRTSSPRRRATRLVSPSLTSPSPKHRRPTLPLQMLNSSTPRLSTMPSSRSLGSRISRLRRGSLDIFWTIQGRKRSIRVKGMVFELVVQGAGVTLVDSTSLNEVAYLCADTLVVDLVRYEGARRALEMKLGSLQLDVHDNSAGWRSNVMLRPKRSRLPVRAVTFERPFLLCSANWLALERGAGPAAHFEVDSLKIDMQPIELRLDTLSSFQLAIFGLELLRRAEPLLGAAESFGHLRRLLKTHWRSDGEQLLVAQEGARDDPVLGEPPCPEYDDFDVPTPVFIKQLLVRRIQFFVSVRFNGKASASGNCSSEALQAVDIVLRKLIPFDVSQARLSLGPFFRRRPGTVAPKGCRRCFRKLLFGEPSSDVPDLQADLRSALEESNLNVHQLYIGILSRAGSEVRPQT